MTLEIEQAKQLERWRYDVAGFARQVKIPSAGGSIQFETPPHVIEFFEALRKYKLLWLFKSKQIYVSWTLAVQALHDLFYVPNANVLELSRGDFEARELLEKSRTAYFSLPSWMQKFTLEPNSGEAFGFKEMHSRIRAFPSTEFAALGQTASRVIHDEMDFHDHFEENFAHTRPTIEARGQLVGVTTSNKGVPDSFAKNQYKLAQAGKTPFKALFFPYDVLPERGEEWYEQRRQEAIESGTLPQFEGNYPRTIEEALSPISAVSVFDKVALDKLWNNAIEPIEVRKGYIYIFEKPQVGWKYAAGADVGEGVGLDYSVLTIIGKYGGRSSVVALIYSNQIKTDMFAYEIDELCEEYFYPQVAVENNSLGIATVNKLLELNYRNLFYKDDAAKAKGKPGWTTGETNKQVVINELKQNIDNESLITRFKPQIQEMMEYQYVQGRSGIMKPAATGRTHGDTVISLAIANQMAKNITGTEEITIYDYYGRRVNA